jgi:hypothetical protein
MLGLLVTAVVPSLLILVTLIMNVIHSSEMLVLTRVTFQKMAFLIALHSKRPNHLLLCSLATKSYMIGQEQNASISNNISCLFIYQLIITVNRLYQMAGCH